MSHASLPLACQVGSLGDLSTQLFDMKTVCRFCTRKADNLVQIFSREHVDSDGINTVVAIANALTSTKVLPKDGLSQLICRSCLNKFNAMCLFRQLCLRSFEHQQRASQISTKDTNQNIEQIECNSPQMVCVKSEPEDYNAYPGPEEFQDEYQKDPLMKDETVELKKSNKDTKASFHEKCTECGKDFTERITYKIHIKQHSRRSRSHTCQYCDMQFVSTTKLKNHERTHTGERPFQCAHCARSFAQRSNLAIHLRCHNNKSYNKCNFCNKFFKCTRTLEEHTRIHTGERPYLCKICNETFVNITSLREHKRIHPGKRPYQCDYCCADFLYENHLRNHEKMRICQSNPIKIELV